MKKAIILFHGDLSSVENISKFIDRDTLLIAADGGLTHFLKLNILPHVIVGDLDSTPSELVETCRKKGVKIIKHPKEKDQTDSQLAVEYAIFREAQEITIFGVLGDRIDHMTANLGYLSEIASKTKIRIVEGKQIVNFLRDEMTIRGEIGDELSLIPMKDPAKGIFTSGLQYSLKNENLEFGSTRGVSNVFTNKEVKIKIKKGVLMVMHRKI